MMTAGTLPPADAGRPKRSDARRNQQALLDAARAALRGMEVDPEYLALVDPATLEPIDQLTGEALLALAARIGAVRLIDNVTLSPTPVADGAVGADEALTRSLPGKANATCSA